MVDSPRARLEIRAHHFAHYAVQMKVNGIWQHIDLMGSPASLAVFRTKEAALETRENNAASFHGIETRIVRYHTSGYTDVADAPNAPEPMASYPEPEDPPARKRATREIEVIE